MKTIQNLINKEKGKDALIIGAGTSIKDNQDLINKFIRKTKPFTMGINNMTNFWIPDYHLWTNTQRFRTYGNNINNESKLLLGSNISLKVIKDVIGDSSYTLVNYTDKVKGVPIKYKGGKIYGYYRTAGCLAIMILHLMGVKDINIVGMDGYTLHKHKDIKSGKKSQHWYGNGLTDTATWKTCVMKDELIEEVLHSLKDYGIKFQILTPTIYKDFYDSTGLYI